MSVGCAETSASLHGHGVRLLGLPSLTPTKGKSQTLWRARLELKMVLRH